MIAANETLTIDDVGHLLGVSGIGSTDLFIEEGVMPGVVVDVLSDAGSGGTTGLTYPAVGPDGLLRTGSTGRLIAPADPAQNRFNVGVRTVEESSIRVTVWSPDDHVVRVNDLRFPAQWFTQESATDFSGGTLAGSESIEIDVIKGALIIYGASTDNRTNDPAIQFAR